MEAIKDNKEFFDVLTRATKKMRADGLVVEAEVLERSISGMPSEIFAQIRSAFKDNRIIQAFDNVNLGLEFGRLKKALPKR